MTVAVACNLSDGVILGVDSAVTVPSPQGVIKIYEEAEKLFQLSHRPIGIANYGLGAIGTRSIGSYLREFEVKDPVGVVSGKGSVGDVVEGLRSFFMSEYEREVIPALEKELKKPFAELTQQEIPALGFVVGGFSVEAYLSEVWNIVIPQHSTAGSSQQQRPPGDFGTNWYAIFEPIRRYIKGYDPTLVNRLVGYFVEKHGMPWNDGVDQEVTAILNEFEYRIPFAAMPIDQGVEHVRFLVELVINHHKYAAGPGVVGGRARIGKVTYRGESFEIL